MTIPSYKISSWLMVCYGLVSRVRVPTCNLFHDDKFCILYSLGLGVTLNFEDFARGASLYFEKWGF